MESELWVDDLHRANAEEALYILDSVWLQLDAPKRKGVHISPYPARSSEFAGLEEEVEETRFRWSVVEILLDKGVFVSARRVVLESEGMREAIEVVPRRERVMATIAALRPAAVKGSGKSELVPPESVTLKWLWAHVPARMWWSLALVLLVMLGAAYGAGRSRLLGRVVDLVAESLSPVQKGRRDLAPAAPALRGAAGDSGVGVAK